MAASPLTSNTGRLFIRLPGGVYTYYGSGKLGALSKSFGESAPIYAPDPSRPGRFLIIDRIPNTEENFWTTTMMGHVDRAFDSKLALAAQSRCEIDIQAHYGTCNDPTDFAEFDTAYVIEGAKISQYQTTDLVALEPKDTAVIQETVNLSASSVTRILNRKLASSGLLTIGGIVTSMCRCPVSCSTACDLNGCGRLYALIASNTDSLPITLRVAWSDDNGVTFNFVDISGVTGDETGNPIYVGFQIQYTKDYLIIFSHAGNSGYRIYSIPHASFVATATAITPTLIVSGASGSSIQTSFSVSGSVYYGGYDGIVKRLTNQFIEETLYVFYTEFTSNHYRIWASDGLDSHNMVFFYSDVNTLVCYQLVRKNDAAFTTTIINTYPIASTSNFNDAYANSTFNVYALSMISQDEWIIGNDLGDVLKTTDGGTTWRITRSFLVPVTKIEMVTRSIGYLITSFDAGIYRTVDGGETWYAVQADSSWPTDVHLNRMNYMALAVCSDPNTFFVGGAHGGDSDMSNPGAEDNNETTVAVIGYGAE